MHLNHLFILYSELRYFKADTLEAIIAMQPLTSQQRLVSGSLSKAPTEALK